MKAYLINMHQLVPRSRSSAKVKVKYKGYISQKMSVSGAFMFHKHILLSLCPVMGSFWEHIVFAMSVCMSICVLYCWCAKKLGVKFLFNLRNNRFAVLQHHSTRICHFLKSKTTLPYQKYSLLLPLLFSLLKML